MCPFTTVGTGKNQLNAHDYSQNLPDSFSSIEKKESLGQRKRKTSQPIKKGKKKKKKVKQFKEKMKRWHNSSLFEESHCVYQWIFTSFSNNGMTPLSLEPLCGQNATQTMCKCFSHCKCHNGSSIINDNIERSKMLWGGYWTHNLPRPLTVSLIMPMCISISHLPPHYNCFINIYKIQGLDIDYRI